MNDAQYTSWLVLPGSALCIALKDRREALPLLEITGNPRGMASLASAFLWLSSLAEGHDFLSVTALTFVQADPGLALSIALELSGEAGYQGLIARLDKGRQYEWQIDDDSLREVACAIHAIACGPEREYVDVNLAPASEAALMFRLTSFEQ